MERAPGLTRTRCGVAWPCLCSFVWWHHSSSDFEYGNLRGAMYQRRLRKLHERHNFDAKRFEQLTALLRRVEVRRRLWLRSVVPAREFLTLPFLACVRSACARCAVSTIKQAEVAHLDLTGYNPALIASYLARNNEGPGGPLAHDAAMSGSVGDKADMDLQYDILLHQEKSGTK